MARCKRVENTTTIGSISRYVPGLSTSTLMNNWDLTLGVTEQTTLIASYSNPSFRTLCITTLAFHIPLELQFFVNKKCVSCHWIAAAGGFSTPSIFSKVGYTLPSPSSFLMLASVTSRFYDSVVT